MQPRSSKVRQSMPCCYWDTLCLFKRDRAVVLPHCMHIKVDVPFAVFLVKSASSTGQQWGTHRPTNMHFIWGQSSRCHCSGGTVSVFFDCFSSAAVRQAALQVILDWTHCRCQGLNQQLLLLSDILPHSGSQALRESSAQGIKALSCLRKS